MNTSKLMFLFFISISSQIVRDNTICQCTELLIEQDCNKIESCFWNMQNQQCEITSEYYTLKYSLEHIESKKLAKSISLYCQQFDELTCKIRKGCAWFQQKCTLFTGCSAYLKTTHEECQSLSQQCISNGISCIEISECSTYKIQYSCTMNKQKQFCKWNQEKRYCENSKTCLDLPQIITTHEECNNQISHCTSKIGGGCIEQQNYCSDYIDSISCKESLIENKCYWKNDVCFAKNCENAPKFIKTLQECQSIGENCIQKVDGGCKIKLSCNDIEVEQTCLQEKGENKCIWINNSCQEKQCSKAPKYFSNNEQCQIFGENCITNGMGCVDNYNCSSALIKASCISDIFNNLCIWRDEQCIQNLCSYADQNYYNKQECNQYMSNCIEDNKNHSCREKTCSEASILLITNHECQTLYPNQQCISKIAGGCQQIKNCIEITIEQECIIDGYNNKCYWNSSSKQCNTIKQCLAFQDEVSCIVDKFNMPCQWFEINQKCMQKSCNTAPTYVQSEQDCQSYYQPQGEQCTTKKGGGCRVKTLCINSDDVSSCTTDKNGNQCYWDITNQKCRLKQCTDYLGNSYKECQEQNSLCTIGFNGYCQVQQMCNQIKNKSTCVEGTDGPCLWIENYQNKDKSFGACFQYYQCNSLQWKSDQQCKLISNYCTTNGIECVPITECQNTNVNGGCVTGVDGECIQTVPALYSKKGQICQKFFFCDQAYYLTHNECQMANSHCTTNGQNGCRDLSAFCSQYNEYSCYINSLGEQKDQDGNVISTGKCQWDSYLKVCRDLECQDLQYETNNECEQKLYKCISNGRHCINKQNCDSLNNQDICNISIGQNGQCIWDTNNHKCKNMECQDILEQQDTKCKQLKNCTSNGEKCIKKTLCHNYENQISCNVSINNEECIWNNQNNQCARFEQCSDSNHNKIFCQNHKECIWNNKFETCSQQTCRTNYEQTGECNYIESINKQTIICKLIHNVCEEIQLNDLTEETCFQYTLNQYYWNPLLGQCKQCGKKQNKSNIEDMQTSSMPNSTTYSVLLSKIIIIILFLF